MADVLNTVGSMQRCAGHPNIVQLLAAYELEPDEANPNGEWHLVMELAEGGGALLENETLQSKLHQAEERARFAIERARASAREARVARRRGGILRPS